MTIVAANWVGENTTTVGTGPLALSGAISKFCPFSVLPDGSEVYYTLHEGANRETGIGVVSNGTLTRNVQATLVAGIYTETNIPISLIGGGQVFAVINADFMTRIYNFSLSVSDSVSAAAASAKSSADSAALANDYEKQSEQNAKDAAGSANAANSAAVDAANQVRDTLIPLSRQYMTLADAQADIANIPDGSVTYVRSTDGSTLADEYINNGGTLEATGRKMPSQSSVDKNTEALSAANNLFFDPFNEYALKYPTLGSKVHFSGTVLATDNHSPVGYPTISNGSLTFSGRRVYIAENNLHVAQSVIIETNTWHESAIGRVAYFCMDSSGVVIGSPMYQYLTTTTGNTTRKQDLTIPSGTSYIEVRADYATGGAGKTEICYLAVYLASADSIYRPLTPYVVPAGTNSVAESALTSRSVSELKTTFINPGKNLFDKSTVTVDSYVDSTSGTVKANTTYDASDFISVTPDSQISANNSHQWAWYNASKVYVSGIAAGSPTTANRTVTVPANCYYLRATIAKTLIDTFQIENGSSVTTYEPFGLKIDSDLLPVGSSSEIAAEVEDARGDTDALDARISPTIDVNGMATSGRFQPEFLSMTRYKLRKIKRNDSGGPYQYSIAICGDSYTHLAARYSQPLASDLRTDYGDAGAGWTGFGFPPTDTISGGVYPNQNGNENVYRMSQTYTGTWTGVYASGNSPDICACHSANVGDKITVSWLVSASTSSLRLFASGGSGVVRYRFSNAGGAFGSWTTVDLTASTGLVLTELTGYGATTWSVEIEVVSGDPLLYGLDHRRSTAGIRLHKLGATGSRAQHWTNADAAEWSAGLAALNPDCVAIFLAPNDQKVYGPETFKGYIQTMIDRVRSALPQADVLLVIAPSNGTSNESLRPMTGYARAAYQLAYSNNCAGLSLQRYFGPDYANYGYGSAKNWFVSDNLHPDALTGGRVILDAFYRLLVLS